MEVRGLLAAQQLLLLGDEGGGGAAVTAQNRIPELAFALPGARQGLRTASRESRSGGAVEGRGWRL